MTHDFIRLLSENVMKRGGSPLSFLFLHYVMTSNISLEKNKMASTLADSVITKCKEADANGLFTKCKEAERWVKFKGNRKCSGEETEKV